MPKTRIAYEITAEKTTRVMNEVTSAFTNEMELLLKNMPAIRKIIGEIALSMAVQIE